VDLFEQISRRLNTRVRLHIEDSWADVQEKAQNREIDGLAFGARDPSRDALYNATDIVMPTYFSVFGRSRYEYHIKRFSDLDGMRIGYKSAARPTRSLLEKLPSAILVPFDRHESLTQALLSREIDVIVAWMSYDHWRKSNMQGTIDNILLLVEYPIEMVTYVRNDWPELIPILSKALAALQKNEQPRLINKWFGAWPQLSPATIVPLTSEERTWLEKKYTVRVRVADWPPYQIVKDSEPVQGIAIEYLKLIKDRTGIKFKYEAADQPFAEFLASMKQLQGPDMTALIASTPEREKYLSFSAPYIASPYVIFIRGEDKPILDIGGLAEKSLAVPRGFVVQEQLARDYPEIRLALFDSDEEALQAVATGQADAYIGNLTVASHIIHKRSLSDLQVTAPSPFGEQVLSMGNRKDWPELTSIINKALASITEEEKTAIRNKYLAIKFEEGINKAKVTRWIFIIGGAASGVVLIVLFWNLQLRKETRMRKASEIQLQRFLERMPIAACMVDKQDNMYYHNNRFIELFGYKHEEIKTLADWWPKAYPDEQYRQWAIATWSDCIRRSEAHGTDIDPREYKVTCKNGQVREMEISGIVLGDRYLATLIDNTERNRTQNQLLEAKEIAESASRAKSLFLANMSHELRTPLNAILGFSKMLTGEPNVTADQQEKLAFINRSGHHLLAMINDILDVSKIEAGRVELREDSFNMVSLIEELFEMLQARAAEKGLALKVETEAVRFPNVKSDMGKLRQILINLLSNAVKFTDKGGVTIRCASEAIPKAPRHCNILIEVEDTGPGIDPARQADIFQPFVQGIDMPARKGTGLGLSICKSHAEAMGGTIEVESKMGQGALFRVRLSAEIGRAPDVRTPVDDNPRVIGLTPTHKTWRILVADDNRANLILLKSLLEEVGFSVLEAENGQEAVTVFKQASPDLIWMDIRMPIMDGYEAVRQIRKQSGGDKLPIIAITASAFNAQRQEILAAGCNDMVIKPFRPQEILEVMGRFLDIEYIYDKGNEAAPARLDRTDLTSARLADLPIELLQELREATLSLNSEAITALIARIEPLAPDTAEGLRTLLDDLQMGRLQDLLEEVK
jgi:PAS domain S-box-containing protein